MSYMHMITRSGEEYVYTGDVSNTPKSRKSERVNAVEQGRRLVFVVDRNNKKTALMYVSRKFYPNTWREGVNLIWGKGKLV